METLIQIPKQRYLFRINGILMISPLMVSTKNVKVSQKHCLRTSIESFTSSSLSEYIIIAALVICVFPHVLISTRSCLRLPGANFNVNVKMALDSFLLLNVKSF